MPRALTTLLALALAGALAAPAAATPKKNPKSPEETVAYWTAERMKNAKPRERAKPGGARGGGGTTRDWSSFAVPAPYTGEHLKNGKVFMTFGGANYVCSGTAVDAVDVNLVWTAGHCVTDGSRPEDAATNVIFVPGYRNGVAPTGEWAYTVLDSTPGWEAQGADKFRYDVGAFQVESADNRAATFDSAGIGTRDIAFDQNPTGKRLVAFGYPAAGKFNGQTQQACSSPFRTWDGLKPLLDPMQISCDMTGGSSGGGWILDTNGNADDTTGEPLVSVNSYGYSSEKNTMYGPYMSTAAQNLHTSMKTASTAD